MSSVPPVLKRVRSGHRARERVSAAKPTRQRTCYFSEALERETLYAPNVSGRLSRLAELVANLRTLLLPTWESAEWAAAMDALRDLPNYYGPHMLAWLLAERLQASAKAVESHYRIKVSEFLQKVEQLDMAQALLVWDVAERFHQTPDALPFHKRMAAIGVELPGSF